MGTAQKLKFPTADFFSKYDQIRRKLEQRCENFVLTLSDIVDINVEIDN